MAQDYKKKHRRIKWAKAYADHLTANYLLHTSPVITPEMGLRFQNAREKMGLNQSEMAERLGLTQTDISRIEHGKMVFIGVSTGQFKTALDGYFEYVLWAALDWKYEEKTYEYKRGKLKVKQRLNMRKHD